MCESLRKKQKVCNQNLLNNENFKKEDNYSKSNDIESNELMKIFINSDETQINELICPKEDIRERLKNDDEKKMVINEAKTKEIEGQCSIYKKKNDNETFDTTSIKNISNALFDSSIQNACIKYLNNNYEKEYFLKCINNIQCNMDKYSLEKKHALINNDYVFEILIKKTNLKDKIAKIFYEKYLLLLNYNNTLNTDNLSEEEIRFLIHCRHQQSDFNDFDYHFFNYLKNLFNKFISTHDICFDYKFNTIPEENEIFYKIFDNLIDKLYYKELIYNEDINENEKIENSCIIELEILEEPVKLAKKSYANLDPLKKWVERQSSCPITKNKLKIEDLKIDQNKKKEVEEWKKKCLYEEIYKTKCCNKQINYNEFKEEFLKKCSNNNNFNEMKCDNCNKFYFLQN